MEKAFCCNYVHCNKDTIVKVLGLFNKRHYEHCKGLIGSIVFQEILCYHIFPYYLLTTAVFQTCGFHYSVGERGTLGFFVIQ